jgi:hypothetical protein
VELHQQELRRVIADYRSAYPDPIAFKAGDRLVVEDRISEWPGWIWCTTPNRKSGWAPESYIRCNEDRGVALRSYDATELSVVTGNQLTIIDIESGWLRCQGEDGRIGWVPEQNVEPVCKT